MKQLCLFALLLLSTGAMAQSSSTTASGTALGNMQGNNQGVTQAIIFDSPGTMNSNINYSGTQTIKNVPSVNGPNLTTSNDTCMGSSSAGANGPGIGVSFGTTWTDEQCRRLKMSRELWNKGMKAASLAMDCMDPAARAALEMTGTRCPQSMTPEERVSVFGPAAQNVGAASAPAPVATRPTAPPAIAPSAGAATAPSGVTAPTRPAASATETASATAKPRYARSSLATMPLEEAVLTPNSGGFNAPNSQQLAALTSVRP